MRQVLATHCQTVGIAHPALRSTLSRDSWTETEVRSLDVRAYSRSSSVNVDMTLPSVAWPACWTDSSASAVGRRRAPRRSDLPMPLQVRAALRCSMYEEHQHKQAHCLACARSLNDEQPGEPFLEHSCPPLHRFDSLRLFKASLARPLCRIECKPVGPVAGGPRIP